MKKIFSFLGRHKLYILIIVLLVICLLAFFAMKSFLYPDDANTVYGDRLEGINEVEITSDRKTEISDKIKENEGITDANISIKGKIINIHITATTEANTIEVMEELSTTILDNFSEDEIAFYDFQFFIKNEDANYDLIGYKNKNSETISWDSDAIVSEVEDNEITEEE